MGHLALKELTKRFHSEVVVDAMNLDVNDGEFVVLVGPSGCGKSTTLRMIAGLESISDGEVLLDGKVLNEVHSSKRNMAMVFQSYALYPHMTVFENIAFGMRVRKVPKTVMKEKVHKAAEILQLGSLLQRKPRELSGGQNQRVALGRAIVRDPEVFLMDEPLSNLDAKLRSHMRIEIKELQQRLNRTMVYVTHDQVEAMTMGDKIVVMKKGVVQQIGSPIDLYNEPNNRFVGEFIGSPPMNFVEGTLVERDGKLQLDCEGQSIVLSQHPEIPLRKFVNQALVLGIRAEKLQLCEEHAEYSYPFEVGNVEVLGGESLIICPFVGGQWISKNAGQYLLQKGATVFLKIKPSDIHLFDHKSERRLEQKYQLNA